MANWCVNYIQIAGKHVEAAVNTINSLLTPEDDEWALDFKHWGVERGWLLLRERPMLEGGVCKFRGDCKWFPPVAGLRAMSRAFAGIRISVSYNIEGMSEGGKLDIATGDTREVKHYRGYFESAEEGDPIHHCLIWSKDHSLLNAIRDAGLTVPGEEQTDEVTVRDMNAVEKLVNERFPDSQIAVTPYTLNEEVYIGSVQTISEHPHLSVARQLTDLMAIVERDIILTHEEVALARDEMLAALAAFNKAMRDYAEVMVPRVDGIALDRYRSYFGSLALRQQAEFHPTGREIKLLLPHCKDHQRRSELQVALSTPRWAKAWPKWEIKETGRLNNEARKMENDKLVVIPKDLLAKLVPDPTQFQQQLRDLEYEQRRIAFEKWL